MRAAILTALAVAAACGGSDGLGELLEDAGRALRDSGDAQAQDGAQGGLDGLEERAAYCDREYVGTFTQGASVTKTTRYYASIATSAAEGDVVAVTTCGYETADGDCPAGSECVWKGGQPPPVECSAGSFTVSDGAVHVYCGQVVVIGETKLVNRFRRAKVFIRP